MPERGQIYEASTGSRFYVVGPCGAEWGYAQHRVMVIEVEGKDPGQEHHLTEQVIESMTLLADAPRRPDDEEAFSRLADFAYGSPNAVWTSPTVLVETALRKALGRAPRSFTTEEEHDGSA